MVEYRLPVVAEKSDIKNKEKHHKIITAVKVKNPRKNLKGSAERCFSQNRRPNITPLAGYNTCAAINTVISFPAKKKYPIGNAIRKVIPYVIRKK